LLLNLHFVDSDEILRSIFNRYGDVPQGKNQVERVILDRVLDCLRRGDGPFDHVAFWEAVRKGELSLANLLDQETINSLYGKTPRSTSARGSHPLSSSSMLSRATLSQRNPRPHSSRSSSPHRLKASLPVRQKSYQKDTSAIVDVEMGIIDVDSDEDDDIDDQLLSIGEGRKIGERVYTTKHRTRPESSTSSTHRAQVPLPTSSSIIPSLDLGLVHMRTSLSSEPVSPSSGTRPRSAGPGSHREAMMISKPKDTKSSSRPPSAPPTRSVLCGRCLSPAHGVPERRAISARPFHAPHRPPSGSQSQRPLSETYLRGTHDATLESFERDQQLLDTLREWTRAESPIGGRASRTMSGHRPGRTKDAERAFAVREFASDYRYESKNQRMLPTRLALLTIIGSHPSIHV
jgi:hypothetical protein